jgi:DEAD/DEAH box helicase domain-containing protein
MTMATADINEYIQSLKTSKRMKDQVAFHRMLPDSPPKWSPPGASWPKEIIHALQNMGIDDLYEHQAKAIDLIRSGTHTVVATPTASGKTLVYNLPVIENILSDPASKALYIFPLKALAQDQLQAFNAITGAMGKEPPRAAIYDGDTTAWHRKKIRENLPHVIFTNPEMIHLSFLPHHRKWEDFYSGLKTVVVDEVHTYRGVMGSHMAQVFRRLNRICSHYGSAPTFVFCSATISNPSELAQKLTGLEVTGITKSGAPQGKRHVLFVDPLEGSSRVTIALLKAALHRSLRTIVYTQSRKMTELLAMWSQNRSGEFRDRISAYRAGLLPEERRAIEARLANGELLAVISTSALELGIDVGDLDLCLLVGYPGTVISTLQRGGRVGRSGQDSALILIAGEDALDQYFMRHPDDLLSREPESAVINPYNRNIVYKHLICAAAELTLEDDEPYLAQPQVRDVLKELEENGDLLRDASGNRYFSNRKMPHRDVDLRGSGSRYAIVDSITGAAIGEIDAFRAYKETHPGAVYLHMGETYLIEVLDTGTHTAKASPATLKHYTRALSQKETEILDIYEQTTFSGIQAFSGRLKVTEEVYAYDKWAIYGKKRLNRIPLDLPPLVFETDGLWFNIPDSVQKAAEANFLHFMGGIHAIEHAAIGIFPLLVLTDRNDLGGISTTFHPRVGGPAVFIYDGVAGGAGLTCQAFKKISDLLELTRKVIRNCPCETGCPSCVHSPKCGSGNRPIDKTSALFVLDRMLSEQIKNTVPEPGKPLASIPSTAVHAKKEVKSASSRKRSAKQIRTARKKTTNPDFPKAANKTERIDTPLHFGVLDIETQRSAEEVGGWHRADRMRVSCAVLYDSHSDAFLEFSDDRIADLIRHMANMDLVVGFNIKRFDYRVLSGYTDFDFKEIQTLDILEDVHRHLGYRLSLDHLSKVTLGSKKTADGLMALKWWKEGKIRKIIDYCRDDVAITRDLYLFGKKNGYLLFKNKAGSKVRIPVKWQTAFGEEVIR